MDFPDNRPPTTKLSIIIHTLSVRKFKCQQGHEMCLMSHTGVSELDLDPVNVPIGFH